MNLLLAVLPLSFAPQDWTALPLPEPSLPRTRMEVDLPAVRGRHLRFGEWESDPALDEVAEIPANLVVQWLQEEARRRGSQLAVAPNTPPLLVSGSPDDLAWARELVSGLDAIGRRLEVRIDAWLVPGRVPGAAEPSALAALEGVRRWTGDVRSGDSILFGDPRRRAFLADYEVEVATDSGVAAPVIGQALTGEQLHLTAHRVGGGRGVQLFGVLDLAELERIEEFDPGTPDLGATEQPIVDLAQVCFSGHVVPGEALRVSIAGSGVGGGDWTLFVFASTTPDPAEAPAVGWRALDLALIASESAELAALNAGTSLARHARLADLAGGHSSTPPSGVLALLGRDRRRDVERPPVQWTDRLLLVHTDDSERYRELSALVAQLESVRTKTTQCRVEQGELVVELPIAAGLPARVLVGSERCVLIDYDAEIAPNTWMPAPRSEAIFDGLAWQARLQGDDLIGECFRSATDEIRVRERGRASLGSVQLPSRRHATGRGRLSAGTRSAWIPQSADEAALLVGRGSL